MKHTIYANGQYFYFDYEEIYLSFLSPYLSSPVAYLEFQFKNNLTEQLSNYKELKKSYENVWFGTGIYQNNKLIAFNRLLVNVSYNDAAVESNIVNLGTFYLDESGKFTQTH